MLPMELPGFIIMRVKKLHFNEHFSAFSSITITGQFHLR
jgi:hypothetical protein